MSKQKSCWEIPCKRVQRVIESLRNKGFQIEKEFRDVSSDRGYPRNRWVGLHVSRPEVGIRVYISKEYCYSEKKLYQEFVDQIGCRRPISVKKRGN